MWLTLLFHNMFLISEVNSTSPRVLRQEQPTHGPSFDTTRAESLSMLT